MYILYLVLYFYNILDIDELDEWLKTHLFHYLLTLSIIGLAIPYPIMSDFWYTI